MSIINRVTTWTTNQLLSSAALNGEFNNVVNTLNNLDSASTAWDNVSTASLTVSGAITAPAFSAWANYTPTIVGCGTPSSVGFMWRRVGDTLQVKGLYNSGVSTGVNLTISFPNAVVGSYSAVGNYYKCGTWTSGNTALGGTYSLYLSGTNSYVNFAKTNGTQFVPALGTDCASNGIFIFVEFEVSITGWTF